MKRISRTALVFSIAFAIFILEPPFLGQSFGPYPLMKIADVLDLFTPLLLIPLYWLLFKHDSTKSLSLKENIFFLLFASFWILGQGMHLAANSIGHLLEGTGTNDVLRLTTFYDETLSHYLWHFGVISLSALLMYRQWRNPVEEGNAANWLKITAGIIYGFTFFAMVIEGNTVPMGLPLAMLAIIFTVVLARKYFRKQPVLFFFCVGYAVAILLFAIWGIWQGGFPEFSEVGII